MAPRQGDSRDVRRARALTRGTGGDRHRDYDSFVIEAAAVLSKLALPAVVLAWTAALAVEDTTAVAVGLVLLVLAIVVVVRSGRLRGKRAEGGP